ncbi:nucleotidyltransferase domain-containing protein [bacterium]|nr:nucleotidyltransferase domain-containing protein [bacterium]
MVDPTILKEVRRYLGVLPRYGIHARRAVLYGSFARGEAGPWSDIDVIVIAPEFARGKTYSMIEDLWGARAHADIRIEPVARGEDEWEHDQSRPLLEIARREGVVIAA